MVGATGIEPVTPYHVKAIQHRRNACKINRNRDSE